MKMNEHALQMLRDLTNAPGASGFEDEVVAVARQYASPIGEMKEDFLRNLYIHRRENTGNKPVLMLDAHTDEVGLIVHSIKPNGCLRFLELGSWNKNALVSSKVLVRNARGEYIPGIIAAKPVHFMTAAERANPSMDVSNMVIDIGATSYQDAVENFHVRMGEPVVPATEFYHDAARGCCLARPLTAASAAPPCWKPCTGCGAGTCPAMWWRCCPPRRSWAPATARSPFTM